MYRVKLTIADFNSQICKAGEVFLSIFVINQYKELLEIEESILN